jgi:colanic acid/amylovoran biosynthesis glycosyltransferase
MSDGGPTDVSHAQADRPVVAHCVSPYLFLTGSWLHSQLIHLSRYRPIVLTARTEHPEVFPFEPIYSYGDVSLVQKALLCVWSRRCRPVRLSYFEWILRRQQARLMHVHFGNAAIPMLSLAKRARVPLVTAFYGADMSQLARDPEWRRAYRRLFNEGDLFLAEGEAMRRGLMDLGCPEEKLRVHRLGVPVEARPFEVRRPDPSGVVRILIAATFRQKKGVPDALRAVERVKRRGHHLAVTLIGDSGGKAGDEEEKRVILDLVGRLEGTVRWVGFQPYRAFQAILHSHHLFLSPSVTAADGDSEGGAPVSLLEAQASGMPVLSTLHADIPEVVQDGRTGFLSSEADVDALAENLERLVVDPMLWEAMGRAGRRHVEANHNARVQAGRMEKVYDALDSGHLPRIEAGQPVMVGGPPARKAGTDCPVGGPGDR